MTARTTAGEPDSGRGATPGAGAVPVGSLGSTRWVLLAVAGALVVLALLASDAAAERALRGSASGVLRWGPALFRGLLILHALVLLIAAMTPGRRARGVRRTHGPAPPADAVEATPRAAWWALATLTLAALLLRLWRIDTCLWYDEIPTLVEVVRQPLGWIVSSFPSQNLHPLYSVLAHGSIAALGESPLALRLPAALLGAAGVPALFLLGRSVAGPIPGLLAAGLLTFAYHHVWFSQNGRGYTGLLLFAVLATWLWLRALNRDRPRAWVLYALAAAGGAWSHMTMVFVVATHALLTLALLVPPLRAWLSVRPDWRPTGRFVGQAALGFGLAATFTLQLHALALPEFLASALHEQSRPSLWTRPTWVLAETVRGLAGRLDAVRGAALLAGAALLLIGWLGILRRGPLAGAALVLPAALAGGTMLSLGHNLWPRFFFFCAGFAILIVVYGAVSAPTALARLVLLVRTRASGPAAAATPGAVARRATPGPATRPGPAGIALGILMILGSAATLPRVYALPKQDFIGARDFVERVRAAEEGVVAVGLAGDAYRMYYAPHWMTAQSADELERARRRCARLWLVYTLPVEVQTYRPGVWDEIERGFDVVKVFPGTLGDGAVTVCVERLPRTAARRDADR